MFCYRHCQLRQASHIDDLQFAKKFPGVLAKKQMAQGKLKLFPMGTLQAVKDGSKSIGHVMEGKGQKYTISGPRCDLEGQEGALVAFFWIKPTTEKAMANMVPTTARVLMAHGSFQATRILPRLNQVSSCCITSPKMRRFLWISHLPGRGRRPTDSFGNHVYPSFQLEASTSTSLGTAVASGRIKVYILL